MAVKATKPSYLCKDKNIPFTSNTNGEVNLASLWADFTEKAVSYTEKNKTNP